ncbi:MAG TPA: hypothetical protein VNU72_05575, partial [Puia sp.]|nr:hypothetical protein [Puia sp.]
MPVKPTILLIWAIIALSAATQAQTLRNATDSGWSFYGHDAGGGRYTPLRQIDGGNVAKLGVAWTYR